MPTLSTLIEDELWSARRKFPEIRNVHEGYAVILEELDEFWDEVRKKKPDHTAMRKELIQAAAMCHRVIEDVLEPELLHEG